MSRVLRLNHTHGHLHTASLLVCSKLRFSSISLFRWSLVSHHSALFIAGRSCSSFFHFFVLFPGIRLIFPLLAYWAFSATHVLRSSFSEGFAEGRVQNFPASRSSSELSSYQITLRALSGCLRQVSTPYSHGSSTTTAKGLSFCVQQQVHSLRHRRHRGTIPALAGKSATTAFLGCMELLLPPTPLPGCSFFVVHVLMVPLFYEDDGTCPPRPPGSASRHRSLRAVQGCVRFDVLYNRRGLLVDSGRR